MYAQCKLLPPPRFVKPSQYYSKLWLRKWPDHLGESTNAGMCVRMEHDRQSSMVRSPGQVAHGQFSAWGKDCAHSLHVGGVRRAEAFGGRCREVCVRGTTLPSLCKRINISGS